MKFLLQHFVHHSNLNLIPVLTNDQLPTQCLGFTSSWGLLNLFAQYKIICLRSLIRMFNAWKHHALIYHMTWMKVGKKCVITFERINRFHFFAFFSRFSITFSIRAMALFIRVVLSLIESPAASHPTRSSCCCCKNNNPSGSSVLTLS